MDFYEMVRTNNACRYYKPDPVDPALIARVVDAARWAPSGGNRQPLRFVIVRDRAKKLEMRNLYLPIWDEYIKVRLANAPRSALMDAADHFARHMEDIPVFVIALARLADVHPTDTQLGRLSIVGGASVYPAVQNMLLAARHEGTSSGRRSPGCCSTASTGLRSPEPESPAALARATGFARGELREVVVERLPRRLVRYKNVPHRPQRRGLVERARPQPERFATVDFAVERRAAVTAKPAAFVRRRAKGFEQCAALQQGEIRPRHGDAGHEGRALRLAALAAVAKPNVRWRPGQRVPHSAAEAPTGRAHGARSATKRRRT